VPRKRLTGLRTGTPVVIGGGDGSCAAAGAGAIAVGDAYAYIGSSAWVMATTEQPVLDPAQRTVTWAHLLPGLFLVGGAIDLAARAREQGVSVYHMLDLEAARSAPGAHGVFFLPYLLGERSPYWNPQARALFAGLTMRHEREDLLRAVLEGVAFNLRVILEAIRSQGPALSDLRAIGGGAQGDLWGQILADILHVRVHQLAITEEATSMGAAMAGGIGVGLWKDFTQARSMARIARRVEPQPHLRARYDRLFRIFTRVYELMDEVGIFAALADLETPGEQEPCCMRV
jgi:xylulokinase